MNFGTNIRKMRSVQKFEVVLKRANGMFVKILATKDSKYAAKRAKSFHEDKYDETYYVEIVPKEE